MASTSNFLGINAKIISAAILKGFSNNPKIIPLLSVHTIYLYLSLKKLAK